MKKTRLLVLFGGRSAERDVSCVSAAAIVRNLSPRLSPVLVRIDPKGSWHLQTRPRAFADSPKPFKFKFDRIPARLEPGPRPCLHAGGRRIFVDAVFPAMHGPLGEDGTLQGLLEFHGLPYVGCGVLGSAVGMDKEMSKRLAGLAGLPQVPYAVIRPGGGLGGTRKLRFPVFVKPARMGSSVGVYRVARPRDLPGAVRKAFRFDTTVIVEQGVPAREIECAVLGEPGAVEASVIGEIRPNAEFYSYHAKYIDPDGAQLIIPARIPAKSVREVRRLAVRAFEALDGFGMARVDFLMDRRTGKLWFNEVNTIPGFTAISMYPALWRASGVSFPRLIDRLVSLAIRRHRSRARLRQTRD